MNIIDLPEDCLAHILSLTSPKDVLRSSVVSKQFLSLSNSDTLWAKFLPPDCEDIVARSSSSISRMELGSKDVFFYLCCFPILLDNRTKSFALDKGKGKICYMLGARALLIAGGSDHWSWKSVPESRFPECAVLKKVHKLDIKGKIHTKLLSPNTTYGVYFVFKVKSFDSGGFGSALALVSISKYIDDESSLDEPYYTSKIKHFYLRSPPDPMYELEFSTWRQTPRELQVVRSDGWVEIQMARYRVGTKFESQNVVLEMTLKEEEVALRWNNSLIVYGIELRPVRD